MKNHECLASTKALNRYVKHWRVTKRIASEAVLSGYGDAERSKKEDINGKSEHEIEKKIVRYPKC